MDSTNKASKRELFIAMFESQISKNWPAKGKDKKLDRQQWWSFVDDIPDDQLKPLFARVIYHRGEKIKVPLLSEFQRAWNELKPKKKTYGTFSQRCDICDGTGQFAWPAWQGRDQKGNQAWSLDGEQHVLSSYVFACRCSAGDHARSILNYPHEFPEAAFAAYRAFLQEHPLEGRREIIKRSEFLARRDAGDCETVAEHTRMLMCESLRHELIREGAPTPPEYVPTKKYTLESLIKRYETTSVNDFVGTFPEEPEKPKREEIPF